MERKRILMNIRLVWWLSLLLPLLLRAEGSDPLEKARTFFSAGVAMAEQAERTLTACPPKQLAASDAVYTTLIEAAASFEEASRSLQKALMAVPVDLKEKEAPFLTDLFARYQRDAEWLKKEAALWRAATFAQLKILEERYALLQEELTLFEKRGLTQSASRQRALMLPILEELARKRPRDPSYQTERSRLLENLTPSSHQSPLSPIVDALEEKRREALLFQRAWLFDHKQGVYRKERPLALAIDPLSTEGDSSYACFSEQFYRFLVQGKGAVSRIHVTVVDGLGKSESVEVPLPALNTLAWEHIQATGLFAFEAESEQLLRLGIELRLTQIPDPSSGASLILALKTSQADQKISIALDTSEPLFACTFYSPPPKRLRSLCKQCVDQHVEPLKKNILRYAPTLTEEARKEAATNLTHYSLLDHFVSECANDPLALARFVQNEIALVDPLARNEQGIYHPTPIHKNPELTFQERQGSPWEQCQLLIYLLRQAGLAALYVKDAHLLLPKESLEKLLSLKLSPDEKAPSLNYPWVLFFDGTEWNALFPWLKEVQLEKGRELFGLLPSAYASSNHVITNFLNGDEQLCKTEDTTLIPLFIRFVHEQLTLKHLTLSDVGILRREIKKELSSWYDFPRPIVEGSAALLTHLHPDSGLFAKALIEIISQENPENKTSSLFSIASLSDKPLYIDFTAKETGEEQLILSLENDSIASLVPGPKEHTFLLKFSYFIPQGSEYFQMSKSFLFSRSATAAFCLNFGALSCDATKRCYASLKKEESLKTLLHYVGRRYFEKCTRDERELSPLYKSFREAPIACAFVKCEPQTNLSENPRFQPQIDPFWFPLPENTKSEEPPLEDLNSLADQGGFEALCQINRIGSTHFILRTLFSDEKALSAIKLLQQRTAKEFLCFTSSRMELAFKAPEAAHTLFFADHSNLSLRDELICMQTAWKNTHALLQSDLALAPWTHATLASDANHTLFGALIFQPTTTTALLFDGRFFLQGGIGSSQTAPSLVQAALKEQRPLPASKKEPRSEIRLASKSALHQAAAPVDVATGALQLDELDLLLQGPVPIEIRRNYSSENPQLGECGFGWKLNFSPKLIHRNERIYVTELDGSIIAYEFNPTTSCWNVSTEENGLLLHQDPNRSNIYLGKLEGEKLISNDGTERIFKEGCLEQWIFPSGYTLFFSCKEGRIERLDGANGSRIHFTYTAEGLLQEVSSSDGRWVRYTYNPLGELTSVEHPSGFRIDYTYDQEHRLLKEIKPLGGVQEYRYDELGRVCAHYGPSEKEDGISLQALYDYQEGLTAVTGASQEKTVYKLFQGQAFAVIDPLGNKKITETSEGKPVTKRVAFDALNRMILEERGESKILFTYDRAHPFLVSRIEEYKGHSLTGYVDREYNLYGQVTKEDLSGAIILWSYDERGFPTKKVELQSGDPKERITEFRYNMQGLCSLEKSEEQIKEKEYDISGNLLEERVYALDGALLKSISYRYNLNNQPISKHTSDPFETLFFEYDSSSRLQAARKYGADGACTLNTEVDLLKSAPER